MWYQGGANGIGASLVELCCQHGAYVCFGDVDTASGEQLARKLSAKTPESKPRASFLTVDVSNYQSNLQLFRTALKTYGKIDHAVAAAGIVEIGNWFDPTLTVENVEEVRTENTKDRPKTSAKPRIQGTPDESTGGKSDRMSLLRTDRERLSPPEQRAGSGPVPHADLVYRRLQGFAGAVCIPVLEARGSGTHARLASLHRAPDDA